MKRFLLASAACLALSLPAMAQTSGSQANPPPQNPNQQQSQAANRPAQPAGNQQAMMIRPSSLSKSDIRDIQMSLNKAGFNAEKVDGIWGRSTREAVMNFQKEKNLPGKGELNQQTLAALGVKVSNQSQANANRSGQQPNLPMANGQTTAGHNGMATMSNHAGSASGQGGLKTKTP